MAIRAHGGNCNDRDMKRSHGAWTANCRMKRYLQLDVGYERNYRRKVNINPRFDSDNISAA